MMHQLSTNKGLFIKAFSLSHTHTHLHLHTQKISSHSHTSSSGQTVWEPWSVLF